MPYLRTLCHRLWLILFPLPIIFSLASAVYANENEQVELSTGNALTPAQELTAFQGYFTSRFPALPLNEFVLGNLALSNEGRQTLLDDTENLPLQALLLEGKKAWEKPFNNGRSYAQCFKNSGSAVRQFYPYYHPSSGLLRTLPQDINQCRRKNGAEQLALDSLDMLSLQAYIGNQSRGQTMRIRVPNTAHAVRWYQLGRWFFYAKRGQYNISCADCHVYNAGKRFEKERISAALGQANAYPVYRAGEQRFSSLHESYRACMVRTRAKPFAEQSNELKALEYFQSYMSNGLPIATPGYRP